ncbi:MAG: hypothetical protein O3C57_08560, partial [Verrucomicrobia bacterium]|nr:hypothetical protein [Verrucomicrobiota bacterium]
MRSNEISGPFACGVMVGLLSLLATSVLANTVEEDEMQAQAERIVSQYKTHVTTPAQKLPSRDVCDGAIMGNGDLGAVIGGDPELQRFYICKNNFWRLRHGHRQGGPRLFGGLDISIPALKGGSFLIEQDIFPAITTSTFGKDGTNVTMRSFVAATDDVLIIEIAAGEAPVEGECRLWPAGGRGSVEQTGESDSAYWVTKAFTNDIVIPTRGAAAMKILGQKGL